MWARLPCRGTKALSEGFIIIIMFLVDAIWPFKEHDMKGFATREGSIKVYCPGLVDKARTMDNQKEKAERLTQPIERLEQRAVVGLNDRAKQLIALQKRREECFLNLKKMS